MDSTTTGTAMTTMPEVERLRLLNQRLKYGVVETQFEAVKQRQNALTIELRAMPVQMKEMQETLNTMSADFNEAYIAAKKKYEVPEGYELNLETGEVVQPPKA
ncbi:MAG: hypothetical protein GY861_24610 [bacterium]|nr:hypothetical protein [bacterium]